MKQEEQASEETLSRWSLDPDTSLDAYLLAASKVFILVAGFVFLLVDRQQSNNLVDYSFYTVSVITLLLIVSSLLAKAHISKARYTMSLINISILLGTLSICGFVSTIDCSSLACQSQLEN